MKITIKHNDVLRTLELKQVNLVTIDTQVSGREVLELTHMPDGRWRLIVTTSMLRNFEHDVVEP